MGTPRHAHAAECYSAVKRDGISVYAVTWAGLENVQLVDIRQAQKDKCCLIPPVPSPPETGSREMRGWGRGRQELSFHWDRVSVGDHGKVLGAESGDGDTTPRMRFTPPERTLRNNAQREDPA